MNADSSLVTNLQHIDSHTAISQKHDISQHAVQLVLKNVKKVDMWRAKEEQGGQKKTIYSRLIIHKSPIINK